MSFDYDRLQDTVNNLDAPEYALAADAQGELHYQAEDMAHELLRLRRELTELRDRMYTDAGNLNRNLQRTAGAYALDYGHRLTRIIQGDTE